MGAADLHERFDFLFSIGDKSLDDLLRFQYLKVRVTGATSGHQFNGSCSETSNGSPNPSFDGATYSLGNWDQHVSSATYNSDGRIDFLAPRPNGPYFGGALATAFLPGEPAVIRVSVRTNVPVTASLCTSFTLKDVMAYFQE